MSVSDEILKLKQLLDGGAITQEEFNKMKSSLLSSNTPAPQPQVTYRTTPQAYVQNRFSKRYFNDTPFKVIGWISVGFAVLFSLVCIILLASKQYAVSMAMVWELTSFPGTLAIIMGAVVKNKSFSSALLVFGIILTVVSIIISVITTSLYVQNFNSSYHYYY